MTASLTINVDITSVSHTGEVNCDFSSSSSFHTGGGILDFRQLLDDDATVRFVLRNGLSYGLSFDSLRPVSVIREIFHSGSQCPEKNSWLGSTFPLSNISSTSFTLSGLNKIRARTYRYRLNFVGEETKTGSQDYYFDPRILNRGSTGVVIPKIGVLAKVAVVALAVAALVALVWISLKWF